MTYFLILLVTVGSLILFLAGPERLPQQRVAGVPVKRLPLLLIGSAILLAIGTWWYFTAQQHRAETTLVGLTDSLRTQDSEVASLRQETYERLVGGNDTANSILGSQDSALAVYRERVEALRSLKQEFAQANSYVGGSPGIDSIDVLLRGTRATLQLLRRDSTTSLVSVRSNRMKGGAAGSPMEVGGWCMYGISNSGEEDWRERYFKLAAGKDGRVPVVGDTVVAIGSVNLRESFIEFSADAGWQNKAVVGVAKPGMSFILKEKKTVADQFLWVRLRKIP